MKNNKLWLLLIMGVLLLAYYKWYAEKYRSYDKMSLEELKQQIDFAVKQDRFRHAIQFIEQAIKLYPEAKELHYSLAHLYLIEEDYAAALKNINIMIAYEERPEYLLAKARILEKSTQLNEALKILLELKQQNFIPAFLVLINIYVDEYRIEEADELIKEMDILFSNDVNLHKDMLFIKANIAMLYGEYEKAENVIKEYLAYRPYFDAAHFVYMRTLSSQGKLTEARQFYQPYLENPKKADYLFYQMVYGNLLSPQEAEQHYASINEHTPEKYHYWLQYLLDTNQLEKAILVGKEALKYTEKSPLRNKIVSYLGQAYLYCGEYLEAEKTFALLKNENGAEYLYTKGVIFTKLFANDFEQVKTICEDAIRVTKNRKNLLRLQILLLEVNYYLQNFDEVIAKSSEILEQLLVGMSEYAIVLDLQAKSYLAQQKYSLARSTFAQIHTLPTSLPEFVLHSYLWEGVCCYLDGEKEDATEILQKAQKIEWEKYLSDTRKVTAIAMILNGDKQQSENIPLWENDILFFQGLYELENNHLEQAQELFQKGLKQSISKEFPYFSIKSMIK